MHIQLLVLICLREPLLSYYTLSIEQHVHPIIFVREMSCVCVCVFQKVWLHQRYTIFVVAYC